MKAALVPDRGVVTVSGDDARNFLNGLLTTDMADVAPARSRFAALLTPQGKIVVDCIVSEAADGSFRLDCPRELAAAFASKLNFYKLRAKVMVEDASDRLGVLALWGDRGSADAAVDPRLPALGLRIVIPRAEASAIAAQHGATLADAADYEAHRIALGVPRGGIDFAYGDAFPHEADMDKLAGIDFDKGCYVGQEVVSRMQHRGTVRTRVVPVAYAGAAPAPGTLVNAGEKPVGRLGSAAQGHALALLRLDRADDAARNGVPLSAAGTTLTIVEPPWGPLALPETARAAG